MDTYKESKAFKISSNLKNLERNKFFHKNIKFSFLDFSRNTSISSKFKLLLNYKDYDYLIINGSGIELFLASFIKYIFPPYKVHVVSLDLLLPEPSTRSDYIKLFIRKILLSKISLFLLYYKKTDGITSYYGIPSSKFRYVPFKVNQIEKVFSVEVADGDYIFCGGKTRRDFYTLFQAVKDLDTPVKIATMENKDIIQHGSFLDENEIPSNVDIIRLDGSFPPFLDLLAKAKLVVLPLKPHICGTGIGVYLMAMALKKCVIISEDVSVQNVLENGEAILVPPQDPSALKDAIVRAYYDDAYRKKIAFKGYSYALRLGGEKELYERILKIIYDHSNTNQ